MDGYCFVRLLTWMTVYRGVNVDAMCVLVCVFCCGGCMFLGRVDVDDV